MKKKILGALLSVILCILPFLVGNSIGKYSPYVDTNSFQSYVLIWAFISLAFVALAFSLLKFYAQSFERMMLAGAVLFLLVSPMTGIVGLVSPPELSIKMLAHPEREHLRYTFLFIGAILFGIFAFLALSSNIFRGKRLFSRILTVIMMLAFAEFIWEFNHHYHYPEALKAWVDQGNTAEAFGKSYDHSGIITIGVIGRFLQFLCIIGLSVHFYKTRQIHLWCPIICVLFSVCGLISATVIYVTEMNLPKGFEMLFLFFIPGILFLLLYWLGVGLLTRVKAA